MAALDYLRRAGLSVERVADRLRVSPAKHITDNVRDFIREHRAELLAELSAANDGNHLELPSRESPRYIHTDATATPEWRHARDLYINHLMRCRACYAPRNRYCPDGAELRARYDSTPMEATTAWGGGG